MESHCTAHRVAAIDAQAQMSLQQMFANASEGLVELDSENSEYIYIYRVIIGH